MNHGRELEQKDIGEYFQKVEKQKLVMQELYPELMPSEPTSPEYK